MSESIGREELVSALASGRRIVVLEALDRPYWEVGHIPGAIAAPPASIDKIAAELANKDDELIVYCASITCQNSGVVARKLRTLGYTNVRVYREGKADWEAAGLPLEKSVEARVAS